MWIFVPVEHGGYCPNRKTKPEMFSKINREFRLTFDKNGIRIEDTERKMKTFRSTQKYTSFNGLCKVPVVQVSWSNNKGRALWQGRISFQSWTEAWVRVSLCCPWFSCVLNSFHAGEIFLQPTLAQPERQNDRFCHVVDPVSLLSLVSQWSAYHPHWCATPPPSLIHVCHPNEMRPHIVRRWCLGFWGQISSFVFLYFTHQEPK